MAIRDIVTAGFGNGTFSGTIPLVVTRGYAIGEEPVTYGVAEWEAPANLAEWEAPADLAEWEAPADLAEWEAPR